jgi:chromosome partitioning protein
MAIIVVCSDKGGGGKTTAATNIASYLALEGRDVVLMDADNSREEDEEEPEGDATGWLALRAQNPELVRIHHAQGIGRIASSVRSLAERFQDVIVDTGSGDTQEMRSGLKVAHLAVMPFSSRLFDQWAARRMARLVRRVREEDNPELVALGYVNFATTNWMSKRASEALSLLGSHEELRMAEGVVYLRDPIETAQHDGRSIFEVKSRASGVVKAAEDMAALMQAVIDALGDRYQPKRLRA